MKRTTKLRQQLSRVFGQLEALSRQEWSRGGTTPPVSGRSPCPALLCDIMSHAQTNKLPKYRTILILTTVLRNVLSSFHREQKDGGDQMGNCERGKDQLRLREGAASAAQRGTRGQNTRRKKSPLLSIFAGE